MKPAPQDIDIYRGDTFEIFFRVRTKVWNPALNGGAGGYEPGPYKVLTGWTGLCHVRSSANAPGPPEAVMTVTIVDQIITPGGVLARLEPAETQAITIDAGVWDIQLADGTDVFTYLAGAVAVDPDVSRV